MIRWTILIGAALAVSGSVPPVVPRRCSVETLRGNPEGYEYPLESVRGFVAQAEHIVRAVALDSVAGVRPDPLGDGPPGRGPGTRVSFRVVERLRGAAGSDSLVMPGVLVQYDNYNAGTVPYRIVRSAGQRGDCYAHEYRRGAEYLFLLRSTPAGPSQYWAPLAPVNEQIRGSDDPWLKWVRTEAAR